MLLLALAWEVPDGWAKQDNGVAVRPLPDLPEAKGRKVKNLDDSALNGVTVARAFEAENGHVGQTVMVGRGMLPGVGRWVYVVDDTVWWQVFWKEDDGFHQGLHSAPIEKAGALAVTMSRWEMTRPASEVLLFDANRADCLVTLKVDLNEAMGQTRQMDDLHRVLEGVPPLAAVRAGGMFNRHGERCVHAAARDARACRVLDAPGTGSGSVALQDAVVQCLDDDTELIPDIQKSMEPWL